MKRFSKVRFLAIQALAMSSLLFASLGVSLPAHAANSAAVKPAPTAPADAQTTLTQPSPEKETKRSDTTQNRSAALAAAWSVSLSTTSSSLWPTQYTSLTASANQNVGPTPYYISIYDQTANSFIRICATGTLCSVSVTQATATTHVYKAYVSYYPSVNPPSAIQATSGTVSINWRSISVSLAASPTTQWLGSNSTLTATTSADVGPTPFYTQIFDTTTGTRVTVCGFGTTCSVAVTKTVATTHKFTAYVSNNSTANPPTGIRATSLPSFVTWANTGYRVSINSSRTSYGHETVTATSNVNVGPTPYYIQIFNLNTGARVAVCGSGTTCSANVALGFGQTNFVAFTSSYSTTIPPLNTQASSAIRSTFFLPIFQQNN